MIKIVGSRIMIVNLKVNVWVVNVECWFGECEFWEWFDGVLGVEGDVIWELKILCDKLLFNVIDRCGDLVVWRFSDLVV